jgi:hypothetical protein
MRIFLCNSLACRRKSWSVSCLAWPMCLWSLFRGQEQHRCHAALPSSRAVLRQSRAGRRVPLHNPLPCRESASCTVSQYPSGSRQATHVDSASSCSSFEEKGADSRFSPCQCRLSSGPRRPYCECGRSPVAVAGQILLRVVSRWSASEPGRTETKHALDGRAVWGQTRTFGSPDDIFQLEGGLRGRRSTRSHDQKIMVWKMRALCATVRLK